MKKIFLPLFTGLTLCLSDLSAQIQFENKTHLLTPAQHFSGVAIAVLDMNGDGLDDIVRMNQGFQLAVEFQTAPNQPFTHLQAGDVAGGSQWGMCAADVDNNGFPDVLTGGAYDDIKVAVANSNGSAYDIITLDEPGTFVQCVNFADVNNDGWLDAFVCHDDGASRIFGNDGAGNLALQPGWINLATVPPSDNSGNYGSVWSDVNNDGYLDLYIAKCRSDAGDPTDPRRINQLFLSNGDGTYTQDTTDASGLRIGAQSWTADFGDIDNDGDFDCFITNHDVSSQLLENDGQGHFTDISVAAGIQNTISGLPIQGIFRDFDNDGFADILVAGTGHYLLRNNGDKTFTTVQNLFGDNQIESFATGDLNHDGFQDVYAGYAEVFTDPGTIPDAMWMNVGNDNKFFGLNLRGVQSNRNAVGAKILLYSALGVQAREVRAGESYGIMNSMQIHFGLGQANAIDSVVVRWPSGTVDVLTQPLGLNQYITVEEGGCVVPQVTAYTDGATTFCSGDSVQIATTDAFAAYKWSTGDTTAQIVAQSAGNYSVTVTTDEGCTAVSNAVSIQVDPVEIPVISVSGDSVFCAGGMTTLAASPAFAYTWSTGDTTQSIAVAQAGTYTVTTQGLCAQFSSAPQTISVLDNPPPQATGDTVQLNMPATLVASGGQLQWFDAQAGGNLLYTGDTLVTQPLTENTTYWVSSTTVYDQPNAFTGMTDHQGTLFGDMQVNGQIIFDCQTPVRLLNVKVYSDVEAERKIDLRDGDGNLLQSKSVNIPEGTSIVNLDFDIPVANDLVLTTDEFVNFNSLGSFGPQLRRSSQGVAYPYVVPNVLSIKNSNFGLNRYYYFYNWEVDFTERACISERVPVVAVVDTVNAASEPAWAAGLRVFPNPTGGSLTVEMENFQGGDVLFAVKNPQGAVLKTQQLAFPSGKMTHRTDVSVLPKGVYLLELKTGSDIVRRKIIVP